MSEERVVIRIIDDNAKHGISAKTNKPWSMSRVELDSGESVFIFNPIEQNDRVIGQESNGFLNYQKVKPDPKHDEIMKALRAIYKVLTVGEIGTPPAAATNHAPAAPAAPKTPTVDEVIDVNIDEPINLQDIPF